MKIDEWLVLVGNGIDQTNILLLFAIFDLVLGISYRVSRKLPLTSNQMLGGLIHNFVPALLPALIYLMNTWSKTHSQIYDYASFIIFISVAYFIIQSILSNLNLLGLKLPAFLMNWINSELKRKEN